MYVEAESHEAAASPAKVAFEITTDVTGGITHSPQSASGAKRRAARNGTKCSEGSLGIPEWRREGAGRPIRPSSEALPEHAGGRN